MMCAHSRNFTTELHGVPRSFKTISLSSSVKLRVLRGYILPQLTRIVRPILAVVLSLVILTLLVLNFSAIKIENNISSLYTMSASLLESEQRAARVLDYGSTGWYFIVTGSSPEETLENEEKLTARLEEEISKGNL